MLLKSTIIAGVIGLCLSFLDGCASNMELVMSANVADGSYCSAPNTEANQLVVTIKDKKPVHIGQIKSEQGSFLLASFGARLIPGKRAFTPYPYSPELDGTKIELGTGAETLVVTVNAAAPVTISAEHCRKHEVKLSQYQLPGVSVKFPTPQSSEGSLRFGTSVCLWVAEFSFQCPGLPGPPPGSHFIVDSEYQLWSASLESTEDKCCFHAWAGSLGVHGSFFFSGFKVVHAGKVWRVDGNNGRFRFGAEVLEASGDFPAPKFAVDGKFAEFTKVPCEDYWKMPDGEEETPTTTVASESTPSSLTTASPATTSSSLDSASKTSLVVANTKESTPSAQLSVICHKVTIASTEYTRVSKDNEIVLFDSAQAWWYGGVPKEPEQADSAIQSFDGVCPKFPTGAQLLVGKLVLQFCPNLTFITLIEEYYTFETSKCDTSVEWPKSVRVSKDVNGLLLVPPDNADYPSLSCTYSEEFTCTPVEPPVKSSPVTSQLYTEDKSYCAKSVEFKETLTVVSNTTNVAVYDQDGRLWYGPKVVLKEAEAWYDSILTKDTQLKCFSRELPNREDVAIAQFLFTFYRVGKCTIWPAKSVFKGTFVRDSSWTPKTGDPMFYKHKDSTHGVYLAGDNEAYLDNNKLRDCGAFKDKTPNYSYSPACLALLKYEKGLVYILIAKKGVKNCARTKTTDWFTYTWDESQEAIRFKP
jgi:hypothetical protein